MKVKICGMRDEKNILEILEEPPDYMGFIFYEKSSRFAGDMPPKVMELIPAYVGKVGVFVNATQGEIEKRVDTYKLDLVQLHGVEPPVFCQLLKERLETRDISLIKVFNIAEDFDFKTLHPYNDIVDYFLFDTKGKLPGGNGYTFDWTILEKYSGNKPFFLSGGIDPSHISIIKKLKLKGLHTIDINSKFEKTPAVKDFSKTAHFISELRKVHPRVVT
ncbi:MAG: phosphoribosylanthranilate isomerase [Bacteroidota bacterium]